MDRLWIWPLLLTLPSGLGCGEEPAKRAPQAEETPVALQAEEALPADLWQRQRGVDWPRFLGPEGNGKSPETGLPDEWPAAGPPVVWQRRLGPSYGIGSVSRGRYFQFDRQQEEAVLFCLQAETGELLWQFSYPSQYSDLYQYDPGPRCSPVVDGNRVYIYGVEGMLHCLRVEDGKELWKVDTVAEYGVVQNFFGVGSTPVVHGELLLVVVGGSPPESQNVPPGALDRVVGNGSGVVAFDKRTGKERYRLSDQLASYASLTTAEIGGRSWCFAFLRGGLLGFQPNTGEQDFFFPWRARTLESVNASTPVVVDNEVFISETYGPGSALLRVRAGGYDVVWQDDERRRDKALQAHWNTPIVHDGYLYGCSGRHTENADLRCINWKNGEVQWTRPDTTRCSLLYVDGHLVSLGEYGDLTVLEATPQAYRPLASWQLSQDNQPLLKYPCWAAPILAHGLLYVRGRDRVVCLDLIPQ